MSKPKKYLSENAIMCNKVNPEYITFIEEQLRRERECVDKLYNEIRGIIGLERSSITELVGNTNMECLDLAIEKARETQKMRGKNE